MLMHRNHEFRCILADYNQHILVFSVLICFLARNSPKKHLEYFCNKEIAKHDVFAEFLCQDELTKPSLDIISLLKHYV